MTTYPESAITNFFYSARIIFCIIVVLVGIGATILLRRATMAGKFIFLMYGMALAFFSLAIILKGLFSFENVWNIKYMMQYITYLGDPASYSPLSGLLLFAYLHLSIAITGTIFNLVNLVVPIRGNRGTKIEDNLKDEHITPGSTADRD